MYSYRTYVNVYAITRHYGGPEEGGWWYNTGEPIESRVATDEHHAEVIFCPREAPEVG